MEEQWVVDRGRLRELLQAHPEWTQAEYAAELKRSVGWVKEWSKRLCQADVDNEQVLHGRSRTRKRPPEKVADAVVERILDIRDHPPEGLQRTPGPKPILYYLGKDKALQASGERIPRSHTTIWKILEAHQRIPRPQPVEHKPMERPAPMESWQMDFKSVTTIPAMVEGQLQHPVETLNVGPKQTLLSPAATFW